MTSFSLSTRPPSVNNLFATVGRRRIKSRAYKAWLKVAGWEINSQRVQPVAGRVAVAYAIERPKDNRRRDVSNLEKGLSDLLVTMGIIADDSLIDRISIGWAEVEGVRVTIEPVAGGLEHISGPLARVMEDLAAKVSG